MIVLIIYEFSNKLATMMILYKVVQEPWDSSKHPIIVLTLIDINANTNKATYTPPNVQQFQLHS